jgi:Skp family chaperone for outer membrane proteins
MKLFKRSGKMAAVMMLCLAAAGSTVAPRAVQAQTLAIGVVDEDKLGDGFVKFKTAVTSLNDRAKSLEDQLEARKLLNDTEGGQFETLISKETRTKAEEDTLAGLVKNGLERQAEYIRINGNATRTDADKARLKQLTDMGVANISKYQTLSDKLFSSLKQQQDNITKQYIDQAQKTIGEVAAEKKLALVVRAGAVVWNAQGTDITDEVLKRLNK